ncbi:Fungal transcriptional regulatory N-terminal protein [Rutstroemia sp. NJR-2017a WRK4]|nr:Fungal transcriptional regulatory N-terminal protein [Rutstroemia sp. NJR-2017a WRK4]
MPSRNLRDNLGAYTRYASRTTDHPNTKLGCLTCRGARVKCRKQRPICDRCDRMGKECHYAEVVSKGEKRRRRQECMAQRPPVRILPGGPEPVPFEPFYEGDSSAVPQESVDPGLPTLAVINTSTSVEHDPASSSAYFAVLPKSYEHPILQGLATEDLTMLWKDEFSLRSQHNVMIDFSSQDVPFPLRLSSSERMAIDHYRNTLSQIFATKDSIWCTQQIYVHLGAQDPLVLHFLLALSLRDLHYRNTENQELSTLAQRHFRAGIGRLLIAISEDQTSHHLGVMAAFWFLYMLGSSTIHAGIGTMMLVSRAVRDYMQKHVSGFLYLDQAGAQQPGPRLDQALVASVTIWMFYADIGSCFCYRGGDLARYICKTPDYMSNMVKISRGIFKLNWVKDCNDDQAVDHDQNIEVFDLLWKSAVLCQEVNDLDQELSTDELEQRFCEIECTYSWIFQLAAMDFEPRPRFLMNADWVVSYFYAVRIYHFRYSTRIEDPNSRPKVVKKALKSLLAIAHRVSSKSYEEHFERLHWPLFMAGLETSDPIHREWILEKFSSGKFRSVLERVVMIQHLSGSRVGMSLIREMCSEEDTPRVSFLGF